MMVHAACSEISALASGFCRHVNGMSEAASADRVMAASYLVLNLKAVELR